MNKPNKRFGIYAYTLLTISAVAITLRAVGALLGIDEYGYFTNELPSQVSGWMLAIGVLFSLTYPITREKPRALIATFFSPGTLFFSSFIAVALAFMLTYLFPAVRAFLAMLGGASVSPTLFPYLITAVLTSLFALLAIGYFVAHALIPEVKSQLRAYLGMATALFYASYAALLYFDTTLPLNASSKLADQAAYLCCALFFLFETRIALGREKWHLYTAFGLIAASVCAYSSIPTILIYIVNGRMISGSIYEATLTFASFLFILSRLFLMRRLKTDMPTSFVTLISTLSKAREEEIAPIPEDANEDEEPTDEGSLDEESLDEESMDETCIITEDVPPALTEEVTAPAPTNAADTLTEEPLPDRPLDESMQREQEEDTTL